jgi:uncharacterized membrane protein (UPF0182 family)
LVIPLDDTLLFVAPIYLRAERSPMPELRIVVLATEDRLAYGATFDEALGSLVGRTIDLASDAPPPAPGPAAPETGSGETDAAAQARRAFEAYRRLTGEGRLGEAGEALEALGEALRRLTLPAPPE